MAKKLIILAVVVGAVLVAAFIGFGSKKNVIATIGSERITIADLQDRIKTYPPQFSAALQQKENKIKVLDQMIDEKLLLAAAKKEGLEKNKDFKAQIENAKNQLLLATYIRDKVEKDVTVSDEDVKTFYQNNPNQFKELEQRRASHILVKTEAEAADVLKALRNGADFAALAKAKSADPSAANGGDLGWFTRGQLVPDFEKEAFALPKGKISGIVKTQFGYHVIKMVDVQVRPRIEFNDQVAKQIKDALLAEKKRTLTADCLAKLRKDIKVKKDLAKLN